jgi:hypothetical protein
MLFVAINAVANCHIRNKSPEDRASEANIFWLEVHPRNKKAVIPDSVHTA